MDDRTDHLDLPLPHPEHMLSEDVLRLREALTTLDGAVADKAAASDVLSLLGQEASARETADQDQQQALASLQAAMQSALAGVLGQPPASLDTLEKLAAALGNDPAFSATVSAQLAGKVDIQTLDATLSTAISAALNAALSGLRQRLYFMGGQ